MSDSPPPSATPDPFRGALIRADSEVASAPRELSQLRILLVDEAASMRRTLHGLLQDIACHHITEAADGASALIELHNRRFDMVISDMLIPGMGGLGLVRAIRADTTLRQIPVLMVSAQAQREAVVAAAQAGVNAYLLKPFTAAMLEDKIKGIFRSMLSQT